MNCSTHHETAAVAFCRTCGKALCGACTRDVRGVVYCEACLAARLEGVAPAAGFVAPQAGYAPVVVPVAPIRAAGSGPNPAVAGILAGFFPFGVGAVYCSQYAKGLAHLLILGLLIFGAGHAGSWDALFGFGIGFFYIYQIIDAVRTAKALQEGQPAPDPFGLAQAFSMGEKTEPTNVPIVAIVLIGLGVLFLLHTMNIWEFGVDRLWPLALIGLGAWMFAKQFGLVESRRAGCPCDRCRMRKIMGPAMLVTVGTLFLLDSLHVADFGRTWPAILLVVGVVKLLQSNASMAGHVDRFTPMSVGPAPMPPVPPPASGPQSPDASAGAESSSAGEVSHG